MPAAPLTSWGRAEWTAHADAMLLAVRPFATPARAGFALPGPRSGFGPRVDRLEAFARTFLLAGFRLAGERGTDPLGLADWYAAGLAAGTNPYSPERWPRMDEHPQAKVEAASVALILDLTREWIWDALPQRTRTDVVAYLSHAVGDETYHPNNWRWFRLVVQTFLRSVDGPHDPDEMRRDLDFHDSLARGAGWLSDGDGRNFDHYVGWALHLYPTLWARMRGAEDLAAPRRERDLAALDRYLQDAVHLVGADGSPLIQGRSLVYRFAAAAPFWAGALAGVPSVPAGRLRRAASLMVQHFAGHGAPDAAGLLNLGWFHEWPALAQSYSGTGSAYWASKGMLGLALPADHPAWTEPDEPLPVESGDFVRTIGAPGWLVSGTAVDGVVRVWNHGTDHARPGDEVGESPLYARIGYSTATFPLLDDAAWTDPLDGAVAVVDADGRASHRTGMTPFVLRVDDPEGQRVGVAGSVGPARWLTTGDDRPGIGGGLAGRLVPVGDLVVVSLVRGPHEVRLARLTGVSPRARRLRLGGWPVADDRESRVTPLTPGDTGLDERPDASPLGEVVRTPFVDFPVVDGGWVAAHVVLGSGAGVPPCRLAVTWAGAATRFRVGWPDGAQTLTTIDIPDPSRSTER